MTPQQMQLNSDLPHTEVFKGVQIEIDGLKEGQEEIKQKIDKEIEMVHGEFEKGSAKFDDLYSKVEEMKNQITKGFKEVKEAITENEISKLKKALSERDETIKTQDKRAWEISKIVITAVLSIVATVLLYRLGL